MRSVQLMAALFAAALTVLPAAAADATKVEIAIKDHRFVPAEIHVPAGERIRLVVRNEDAMAEEFESYELNREKVIPGGTEAVIFVGPLRSGTYPFFGEFHPETAQGRIIAE